MKEIDFLPEWYKQGRSQQKKHREFYIALGLIVLVMTVWTIFANGRVAVARAKNTALQNSRFTQMLAQNEYDNARSKLGLLLSEQKILDSVDSHIVVSNIIAEMSHLFDRRVVLKKLEIKKELFGQQGIKTGIQVFSPDADKSKSFSNNARFKIVFSGLASDAAQVAETLNKLEQSDYFFQVIPGFSRNTNLGQRQVCEFEMTCYLSNYIVK
ncbi:MAG: hypothetical protein PHP01_02145 [Phycisphaerae bacterium]|nr:hypothetical protein [Phycisphaerae bacterium]